MDEIKVLDLQETGTRYAHYQELREVFALGVDMLETMNRNLRGSGDLRRLTSLRNAVAEIDNRLEVLSGYRDRENLRLLSKKINEIEPRNAYERMLDNPNRGESNYQN